MKKLIKKIVVSILSLTMLITIPSTSIFADESDEMTISIDENGYEIAIDTQGKIYKYFDVNGNYVPASKVLNEDETNDYNHSRAIARMAPNSFTIRSTSTGYGSAKKVSASCVGPCTITYSNTITTTHTISITLSASMKAKFIATLKAEASITWVDSSSTSLSYALSVDSGKTGSVYFKPKIRTIQATFYDSNLSGTLFTATCPVKLDNGLTDGVFYIVYE